MQYHESTLTFANKEIVIKMQRVEDDTLFPANIKWHIDHMLTSNNQAAMMFEQCTVAETWIMHKCQELWPNRAVVVSIHPL
jgi:hypothetical protein